MLLIIVASLLWLEVVRDFRQDNIPDAVDGLLVLTIAGPYEDKIGVEAYREGEATDVVLCVARCYSLEVGILQEVTHLAELHQRNFPQQPSSISPSKSPSTCLSEHGMSTPLL